MPSIPQSNPIQIAWQQEEHASEVASLETDLHGAETRCRDARHRIDLLRDSRAIVAELAVTAYRRRRRGITIAAGAAREEDETGDSAPALVQRWCFWGWARVTRCGSAAMARKERRAEAEKELPGVREMLSAAVERARGAEAERDRHGLVSFLISIIILLLLFLIASDLFQDNTACVVKALAPARDLCYYDAPPH